MVEIRRGSIEDVYVISRIHASSWKSGYKDLVPNEYLDNLKNVFWVSAFKDFINKDILKCQIIFEDKIPVGCISYGPLNGLKDCSEIVSLYVIKDYWRKGYGNMLLNYALKDMKNQGYKNTYLWVLEENINARRFYEKNNFHTHRDKNIIEIMNKKLVNLRYIYIS